MTSILWLMRPLLQLCERQHRHVISLLLLFHIQFGYRDASASSCYSPLGLTSGAVLDWQLSASSSYPTAWDSGCHVKYARLHQPNGKAWCSGNKAAGEWLFVDLGIPAKVTGMVTQGKADGEEWVSKYQISYSLDAYNWHFIKDIYDDKKVFRGNTNSHEPRTNVIEPSISARFIRVHVVEWHTHPSLRLELLGCQECNTFISEGIQVRVSASSFPPWKKKKSCQPYDAAIDSEKGWCAKKKSPDQWLQFDLGPPHTVMGVVSKGRGDSKRKDWVRSYSITYSNDSKIWFTYKDGNHLDTKNRKNHPTQKSSSSSFQESKLVQSTSVINLDDCVNETKETLLKQLIQDPNKRLYPQSQHACKDKIIPSEPNDSQNTLQNDEYQNEGLIQSNKKISKLGTNVTKVFGGNMDKHTERRHYLNSPFTARYVRVHPIRWHRSIAMRVALIGCPHSGECGKGFFRITPDAPCMENLALEGKTWVNDERHQWADWNRGKGPLAVDGSENRNLNSCTVVENFKNDEPVWMVDLGKKKIVTGILLHTWQGQGEDEITLYRDFVFGLDKLSIFVEQKPRQARLDQKSNNECVSITRRNNAVFKEKIHLECPHPMEGRYVYAVAKGVANRWHRIFSLALCEIMVY